MNPTRVGRIIVTFIGCVAVDAAVSMSALEWPATVHLLEKALYPKAGSEDAHYTLVATILLVGLAWGMYLLAGVAASMAAQLRAQLVPIQLPDQGTLNALEITVRRLFSAPSTSTDTMQSIVQKRYLNRIKVGRDVGLKGVSWQAFALLEPRAFTGYESLTQGLRAGLDHAAIEAQLMGLRLGRLGDIAATLGLSGTVLGLIVGGKNLNDPANVGLALQAAMLKTFVGFMIKLYCMYQTGVLHERLERFSASLDDAVARAMFMPSPRPQPEPAASSFGESYSTMEEA